LASEHLTPPIVCFSHLRWNFVFQRPQHILTGLAAERRVYYVEEPVVREDVCTAHFVEETPHPNLTVLQPQLPPMSGEDAERTQARLLSDFFTRRRLADAILWYYTPMALGWSKHLPFSACVYDCMDELSMFAFAPPALHERERELFSKANVVFTGGRSLYYAKRKHHANVRCFPSAVDAAHFAPRDLPEPSELASVPRPRFGFYGVIDERFDCDYLQGIADLRPDWQFVVVGPVVKIDPALLPKRANIHYLGQQTYDVLPALLQHWDVAMLPFARNDATRFISPTKTLEYLAAHKPVISTPIADVVDPYGERGLVGIAATPAEFVELGSDILNRGMSARWHDAVDRVIAQSSWRATVAGMNAELNRLALARVLA
jgi:UDP-galactopyranose mutase